VLRLLARIAAIAVVAVVVGFVSFVGGWWYGGPVVSDLLGVTNEGGLLIGAAVAVAAGIGGAVLAGVGVGVATRSRRRDVR
jgi:hypothetical protein